MRQVYGLSSLLFFGSSVLYSHTGLQEGDPMTSLAFALVINPIVANLKSTFKVWYLDDGTLEVELDMVLRDLSIIERAFSRI